MNQPLPQRYGTAIHITPPWADASLIPVPKRSSATKIPTVFQPQIQQCLEKDAYLAWHLEHELPITVIEVKVGQRQEINPTRPSGRPLFLKGGIGEDLSEVLLITLHENAQLLLENHLTNRQHAVRRILVQQQAGSQFEYVAWRQGVEFLNEEIDVQLVGPEAVCKTTHLMYGQKSEQVDIGVRATHRAPHTQSLLMARLAVDEKALALYRGLITIEPTAPGSKGYQHGVGLLLSDTATVDCIPELAIQTDDVSCTHGVTTSSLDELNMMYLQSRGLSEREAQQLVIRAFYEQKLTLPEATRQILEQQFQKV